MKKSNGLKIVAMTAFLVAGTVDTVSAASCEVKAPTDVKVTDIKQNSAKFTFRDYSKSESYFKVIVEGGSYYKEFNISANRTRNKTTPKGGYMLTGLPSGTYFTIAVSAYRNVDYSEINKDVCSSEYDYINPSESNQTDKKFKTKSNPVVPNSSFKKPNNAGAYTIGFSSARIKFKDNATIEDGFKIYDETGYLMKTIPSSYAQGKWVHTSLNSLYPDEYYRVYIVAYKNGKHSNEDEAEDDCRDHGHGTNCYEYEFLENHGYITFSPYKESEKRYINFWTKEDPEED